MAKLLALISNNESRAENQVAELGMTSDAYLNATRLRVKPVQMPLRGTVDVPGSKSITNRAVLLAGLANGRSVISGILRSDDTRHMANALRAMGVVVNDLDATTVEVLGTGKLQVPQTPLFLGNAGTATRFLCAAAALVNGDVIIDGDEHMRRRPIEPLLKGLAQLGIRSTCATGCPPVTIHGNGRIDKEHVAIDAGVSSQFVSALLMLAACADRPIRVEIAGAGEVAARGYIELTLHTMAAFGARADSIDRRTWLIQASGYQAADYSVEADASAATYVWAAEQMTRGELILRNAIRTELQPDTQSLHLIRQFPHMPGLIDGSQMQDSVPTLAVMAAFNNQAVRFTGIANLRVKECDRIRALSLGLNQLAPGIALEDGDELVIQGVIMQRSQRASFTQPVVIDTFNDHRIAMSFALAGLMMDGVIIDNPACVSKTFPGYWRMLDQLGVVLELD